MKKILIIFGIICFYLGRSALGGFAPTGTFFEKNVFAQAIVINGTIQEDIKRKPFEYNLYQESIIIRNERVYIYTAAVGMSRQYYMLHYLLPETVKYDPQTKEIIYINDGKRLVIGQSKKFLNII
ncbi:MAG TPA: hypothetical protein VI387_01625, partial [Candidatus Brocadiales bacterium]|nr:hypothetical protein [Candidatus Brocadiales bacterium]